METNAQLLKPQAVVAVAMLWSGGGCPWWGALALQVEPWTQAWEVPCPAAWLALRAQRGAFHPPRGLPCPSAFPVVPHLDRVRWMEFSSRA